MAKSAEKKISGRFNIISERFCSKLGDNAIIVTTQTENGEERKCLCADRCKAECENVKIKNE